MKKLLYLLLLLPLGFLASCNDDDDFPSVEITMTIDNAVNVDGHLYIVAGEPFKIASITSEGIGNAATISGVNYYLDRVGIGYSFVAPYTAEIPASYLPVGNHLVAVSFDVLQVDKSLASASISNILTVVETAEDLPDGATPGTVSLNYRLNPK